MQRKNSDTLRKGFAASLVLLLGLFVAGVMMPVAPVYAGGTITDYVALPPFLTSGVTPNVLIILDNSNSMDEDVDGNAVGSDAPNSRSEIARNAILDLIRANQGKMRFGLMAYEQTNVSRYELHDSFYYCSYDPSTYDPTGTPTPKDPSTNTRRWENPFDPGHYIYYDTALPMYSSGSLGDAFAYAPDYNETVAPTTGNTYWVYRTKTGDLDAPPGTASGDMGTYGYSNYWFGSRFVPTDEDYAAGFSYFGRQLSWVHVGPTWFSNSSPGGGTLHVPVDDSTSAHITALEEKLATSNFSTNTADHPNGDLDTPIRNAGLTPIAGTLASAREYLEGNSSPVQYWCQKTFVILVTDGLPSVDKDGHTSDADSLLPEVADEVGLLRATVVPGFSDAFDVQTFVLGFALPPELGSKLDDIAVAGGTDVDGHAYLANDPDQLTSALQRIFLEILNRVSSGSAASVISNSRSGQGAVYQSIFYPEYRDQMGNSVNWIGDVHSLFVDAYGNLREDSNQNKTLDEETDRIVIFDAQSGKAELYDPVDYDRHDPSSNFIEEVEIKNLKYIWDAMSWLSDPAMDVITQRTYSATDHLRYIFTDSIDTSAAVSQANVDHTATMAFSPDFVDDAANDNYYFLNPDESYIDASNNTVMFTEAEKITEAQNIIRFIRGEEGLSQPGSGRPYRSRTLDVDSDGTGDTVFRLGDIIHSTPTVVSMPSEGFDIIYNDDSYRAFRKQYLNRRTVVYAGGNDGMLHAFNGGFYNKIEHKFITQPVVWDTITDTWVTDSSKTPYDLGAELWAYVPNALLPHLKWLKEELNGERHVYYVDLKPRVFDARIFSDDADHPGGWGTVLIGGMRLGGGPIGVDTDGDGTDDMHFTSTFFAIDITNPENPPTLLWSFTDDNLGFTTTYPTPIRVGGSWFVIIGSGPTNYQATREDGSGAFLDYGGSDRTASVYVINAANGNLEHEFTMDPHSFMSDPISVDFDLESWDSSGQKQWSGEAIYMGSDGAHSENPGKLFRIVTNDAENPSSWTLSVMYNPQQHITAAPSVAQDEDGNVWVYFGTGRFWSDLDRQAPYFGYQQSFYGIKEPRTGIGMTFATVASGMQDVTGEQIRSDAAGITAFAALESSIKTQNGWYFNFDETGERNLGQAAILGDIVTFSTYVPNNDPCLYEGESNLYGVYYTTGTAYTKGVLKSADNNYTGIEGGGEVGVVVAKVDIGRGYSKTPNLHTGKQEGSEALLQTSTGAIMQLQQANPGITKSGKIYWADVQ